MKSRSLFTLLTFLVSLLLIQAEGAYAAVTLSVAPSGTNRFVVNGSPLDGVAALDITISYDAGMLASPVVEKGSAAGPALFAANPNAGGSVRIAIINATPLQGSGPLAILTFTGKGSGTGNLGITASVVDKDGRQVPVIPVGYTAATVTPPPATGGETTSGDTTTGDTGTGDTTGEGTTGTGQTGTTTGTGATGTTGSTPVPVTVGAGQPTWLAGVTIPTDADSAATPDKELKDEPATPTVEPPQEKGSQPRQASPREPVAEPAPPVPTAERKTTTASSVLAKVRDFKGERTPKVLMGLFTTAEGAKYRQQPPVALSDGVASVKVWVAVPATAKSAPNFALKDAKLVSLRRDIDGSWIVETKPVKGTYTSTVTMLLDGVMSEIPVVVSPTADITVVKPGVPPTEAEFSQFLKERGTDKAPRFDLNKDGKRDYLDDYIFTANYLVLMSKKQADVKPVKK